MAKHKHGQMNEYAALSVLKEWNASFKVCFALASLIIVIAADSVPLSLMTMLFMGGVTCIAGKIKGRDYIRTFLIPAAFIITSGIAVLVQFGSAADSLLCIPFLSTHLFITEASLVQSFELSCKALGSVSCLFFLMFSTPMGEILSVLRKIHVPDIILELMHFIYRYLFILLETNARQKEAARSRMGYCDRKTAIRTFAGEMANLFILSMKRAQSYYDALESRGGAGSYLFFEEQRKLTPKQIAIGSAYFLLACFFL